MEITSDFLLPEPTPEDGVVCPKCEYDFDNEASTPLSLSCGCVVCKTCFWDLEEKNLEAATPDNHSGSFTCPICQDINVSSFLVDCPTLKKCGYSICNINVRFGNTCYSLAVEMEKSTPDSVTNALSILLHEPNLDGSMLFCKMGDLVCFFNPVGSIIDELGTRSGDSTLQLGPDLHFEISM